MHIINSIFLYLGMNSLMYAANTDIVRILLEHGADINAKDKQGKLHTIIVTMSIYPYISIHLFLCI